MGVMFRGKNGIPSFVLGVRANLFLMSQNRFSIMRTWPFPCVNRPCAMA